MSDSLKNQLIEVLKDQKDIFGDELFEENIINRRTRIEKPKKEISEPKVQYKQEAKNVEKDDIELDKLELVKIEEEKIKEEEGLFEERKEEWEKAENLEILNKLICNCTKCQLSENRNKFVFGSGNPDADVLVIGEGPGADEDKQGLPFVGRAGKLLTDILKAIKFSREEVYIANIVKCRPPGNRTPLPAEMDTCLPYLKKQIDLIKPKLILCLGLTAAQGLLKKRESLTKMRGQIFEMSGVKIMVTYHPAALLRNPNWKGPCWEDVQKFRKLYDEMVSN
jgi:uracil-DNA glycosylase